MSTAANVAADTRERVALVTNVEEYAGPGSVRALADAGFTVVCHDESFAGDGPREAYASGDGRVMPVAAQDPQELVDGVLSRLGRIDAVVSNDFIPGTLWDPAPELPDAGSPYMRSQPFEEADPVEFRATLERLVIRPFLLARAVLPSMKERRAGAIVFITSAVSYRAGPE